jgi:hypothetical protein
LQAVCYFGFNRFPFRRKFKPDLQIMQMFLVLLKLRDDFAKPRSFLESFLRFLLILPEVFSADYFFK